MLILITKFKPYIYSLNSMWKDQVKIRQLIQKALYYVEIWTLTL